MKKVRNILFILSFFSLSLTQTVRAQTCLSLYPVPFYDCVSGLAVTNYTLAGGIAPYSYTIVQAGTPQTTVTSGAITALNGTFSPLGIGNYTIFMVDPNGCSTDQPLLITANLLTAPSATITTASVTCNGANNGSATAIPPSPPSFSANPGFTWMPGGINTPTLGNMIGGMVYTLTIRDAKGCEIKSLVTVPEPPPIVSTLVSNSITCFGGVLNTQISTTGTIGATSYSVDGNQIIGNNVIGLSPGQHVITTRDARPCVRNTTVQITQGPQPNLTFPFKSSPTCPGGSDGSMAASVGGGLPPPYVYSWQPGGGVGFSQVNIPAGTYSVTLTYGSFPNACTTISVTTLAAAVGPTVGFQTVPENCSAADGAFTINVGGVPSPYTYTTIPTGLPTGSVVTGISSGVYTVITGYKNICLDTSFVTVGNLSIVGIAIQNSTAVRCNSACDASITLNVTNAVGMVTYSATGTPTTNSNSFNNLCAGVYFIRAVDSNGCPATTSISLVSPPVLSYSAAAPSSVCVGRQATLLGGASGGTGNYNFFWQPGNAQGPSANVTPTTTTVYSLTVYDSNGCTQGAKTLTVSVAPKLSISITAAGSGICPGSTAQITPTVTGGDGIYTYEWLPGNSTGPSIFVQNIAVPVYTLIVKDNCGSPTVVKQIPINLFPPIKPVFSSKALKGCVPFCVQFINKTPKSQLPQWSFGDKPGLNSGDTANYCYMSSGKYDLTLSVIDSNACRTFYTYTNAVEVRPSPAASFVTLDDTLTLFSADNIEFKNATKNAIRYEWYVNDLYQGTNNDLTHSFADTGCFRVRLIATNNNNCSDTIDRNIYVNEAFSFYMPNCFTPNENGMNDSLIPKGTGWLDKDYSFRVFDRWGMELFSTTDKKMGWDGRNSGGETPHNLYIWKVVVTDLKKKEHRFAGSVTLVR